MSAPDPRPIAGGVDRPVRGGILSAPYRATTIGMIALITLVAFESMAVTTVMPTISRDLDGASLYALAFAGPLAVGVVGMVVSGSLADRIPLGRIVVVAAAVFAAGLVVVGTAPTMPVLVMGRLVQGLGGGGLTVLLYVLVARVFPARLHPPIFGSFAAAWVVPSLVGPLLAGVIAETIGWHWIFLGAVGFVVVGVALLAPSLRVQLVAVVASPLVEGATTGVSEVAGSSSSVSTAVPEQAGFAKRLGSAVLVALAVLGLHLAGELPEPWRLLLPVVATVVVFAGLVPLVPGGTLRARRGLPAVIAGRFLLGAAFFGAEVYLPYLLTVEYGFGPSSAGLALTGAGLSWGIASSVQGRLATDSNARATAVIGALLLGVGLALTFVAAALALSPLVAIVAWTISGAGMGTVLPRLSVLMLAYSTNADQGFNSSAAQIADSIGSAVALAFGALVFAAVPAGFLSLAAAPFSAVFALSLLVVIVAALVVARIRAA